MNRQLEQHLSTLWLICIRQKELRKNSIPQLRMNFLALGMRQRPSQLCKLLLVLAALLCKFLHLVALLCKFLLHLAAF